MLEKREMRNGVSEETASREEILCTSSLVHSCAIDESQEKESERRAPGINNDSYPSYTSPSLHLSRLGWEGNPFLNVSLSLSETCHDPLSPFSLLSPLPPSPLAYSTFLLLLPSNELGKLHNCLSIGLQSGTPSAGERRRDRKRKCSRIDNM